MTLEEIMKLIDAGYTKEEIAEFRDLQTDPAEPEPEPEPEPPEDPEPKEPHYADEIAKLTEQVNKLTEAMQKGFLESAEKKTGKPEDGDAVLKNILEKGVI